MVNPADLFTKHLSSRGRVNQLTESEKKQMKLMNTVREFDPWTETRLQYEICRGEQGDLVFIKARHGPRAQG